MSAVTTVIEHVVDIEASPHTVYDLWTTSDGLCAWWAESADVEPRVGGSIVVDIDGEHVMVGEFVELDPPHRLVITFGWRDGEIPPGASTVAVSFDETSSGTRVTLRHSGLPLEFVESHASGWVHFLGERLTRTGSSS